MPADRAGAAAAEDDLLLPGFLEDLVDAVLPPDRQHRRRVAAADVDHILTEEKGTKVGNFAADQGQVAGQAVIGGEDLVEAHDVGRRLTARRRDVADPRRLLCSESKYVILDLVAVALLAQGTAADCDDGWHLSSRKRLE